MIKNVLTALTCVVCSVVSAAAQDVIQLERIATGLARPVFVTQPPGDNSRLFIVEQHSGQIRILNTANNSINGTPFVTVGGLSTGNEQGLLGLAFHPDYQNNGWFFIYYTAAAPAGDLTVRRYTRLTPDTADAASGVNVISVSHPIANHNAGMIAFSPLDGHLYVGTGDGGSGCDPGPAPGNAQNTNSLLGKMLRLNVDSLPYSTAGNPFDGGTPGLDEIWSYGLRNPWRWSFDRITGAQYIGDVGQNTWEEVSCTSSTSGGENYGWNAYEGNGCDTCNEWAPVCPIALTNYQPPIRDYSLAGTPCAIIGGHVYRGCRMGDLQGTYFYADNCGTDFVRTLRTDGLCSASAPPDLSRDGDLEPGGAISIESIGSFGEDHRGELYIIDHGGGEVFKIIPEIAITEVSGPGAVPLVANAAGEFTWENLQATSDVPVRFYKVYRADTTAPGSGPGPFVCVQQNSGASATTWIGGDPDVPFEGQVFYYLVTGQNVDLQESTAGARSDGTLRVVDTVTPCS